MKPTTLVTPTRVDDVDVRNVPAVVHIYAGAEPGTVCVAVPLPSGGFARGTVELEALDTVVDQAAADDIAAHPIAAEPETVEVTPVPGPTPPVEPTLLNGPFTAVIHSGPTIGEVRRAVASAPEGALVVVEPVHHEDLGEARIDGDELILGRSAIERSADTVALKAGQAPAPSEDPQGEPPAEDDGAVPQVENTEAETPSLRGELPSTAPEASEG